MRGAVQRGFAEGSISRRQAERFSFGTTSQNSVPLTRDEGAGSQRGPIHADHAIDREHTAEPARRDAMAKAAARYLHPTLSAVAVKQLNPDGSPLAPVVNITIEQPQRPASDVAKIGDRTWH